MTELEDFVARMRPKLGVNEQLLSFIDFLLGRSGDLPLGRLERLDGWLSLRGSMSLMPEWARRLTGTGVSESLDRLALQPSNRLRARLVRWAYPELPCKRMALERARAPRVAQPASDAA